MKSSLLRTFFEWALITSVLMSVGFFCWYYFKSHAARAVAVQIRAAQPHLQYNQNMKGILGAECQAYARTNADLQRFLTTAAAPTPATKPGAK